MEKIVVSIRVRPLNKQEAAKGSPWKISSNAISLSNLNTGAILQSYVFDSVFGTEEKTVDLYEAHTKAIISSAVKGINGTVFAYGQTSSGKTFTMRGSLTEPGIVPLSVRDIFNNIQQAEDREFLLRVSYMEIYNEEINDLLAPENRKLQVHENLERGIFVAGLREEIVSCPEQVLQLLEFGEAHRHIGETNMNLYSSRSHTIFRMVIESRDRSQDDPTQPSTLQACDAVRVSVLNLVDLAGSERVAKTGAEGARLKEGSHINKSLMTLGTVINKLSEGIESQGGHVPYRDSKLTRILQPALGGNARTVIICNVTPALVHVDETKGTLLFASRAIRVTNCAQVNEIMTDAALLKRQKREIEELRNKLQESHSEHLEEEILNLRNAMLKIELERERMALELQNKAERERRMKEQIENLSTMVLNSAVDDRHTDKSVKKTNRRETWCPRLTSSKTEIEVRNLKTPNASLVSTKRDRNIPLPPPFESLAEEEDSPMKEEFEPEFPVQTISSIYVADRKHKLQANEEELLDLQARYQGLHCDYEVAVSEIEKLRNENEKLKAAGVKSGVKPSDGDRRCKSLDGNQTDMSAGIVSELEAQVQTLEMEKYYMQRELDSRIEHAKSQANSAKQVLEGLYEELQESNEQIEQLTKRNMQLELEKDEMSRSYIQLSTAFEDLNMEVDKSMAHAFTCMESHMVEVREFKASLKSSEQQEVKSLSDRNETLLADFTEHCNNLNIQKSILEDKLRIEEARIAELEAAFEQATKKFEQTCEDESSRLKTELLALQKELSNAKAMPSALQKEKESMRKELEKTKTRLKDIEAKLKTTLQDKSKLEAEKANLDRELKTVRGQSTLLQRDIDKRESLQRRDSLACFNKAKHQLSSAEHALQQKALDLEKTSFELQVLQGAYQELEVSLLESREAVEALQNRLVEAESEITKLVGEKDKAANHANNIAIELEAATEQWGESRHQLDKLQQERDNLTHQLEECITAKQMSEALAKELSKVKEDLAVELTDVYYRLEEEKAVSASRQGLIEEKETECASLKDKFIQVITNFEALQQTFEEKLNQVEHAAKDREAQADACFRQTVEQQIIQMDSLNEKVVAAEIAIQKEIEDRLGVMKTMQELDQVLETKKLELLQAQTFKQQSQELECEKQRIEEEAEELGRALKDSKETCAMYKETIAKLTEELTTAQSKCEELEEEYTSIKLNENEQCLQIKLLMDRICELQDRQKELEEATVIHDGQKKELESAKRTIEEEVEDLKKALEGAEETCGSYKETVTKLRDELASAHSKYEKLEEDYARLKLNESEYCLQNKYLEERISKMQTREMKVEEILEATRIEDGQHELESAKRKIEQEVEELEKALEGTKDTCTMYRETIAKLTDELTSARSKYEQLEEDYARVKNEHSMQKNLLAERISELQTREKELVSILEATTINSGQETELESAKQMVVEVEELGNALAKTKETITKLTEELTSAHNQYALLEEEYARFKHEQSLQNNVLTDRLSELQVRQKELETIVEATKIDENQINEMKRLLVSNTKLQVAFDAMSGRAEVFEVRMEDARWDLIEFRDKAARAQEKLQAALAASKLEIVELKVELENLKRDAHLVQELQELQNDETSTMKSQPIELETAHKDPTSTKRKPSDLSLQASISKLKKLKEVDDDFNTPRRASKEAEERSPLSSLDNLQPGKHKWFQGLGKENR